MHGKVGKFQHVKRKKDNKNREEHKMSRGSDIFIKRHSEWFVSWNKGSGRKIGFNSLENWDLKPRTYSLCQHIQRFHSVFHRTLVP